MASALARPARNDLRVRRESPAIRVASKDTGVDVHAVQGDGTASCDASEALVSVFCPTGCAPDEDRWPLLTK